MAVLRALLLLGAAAAAGCFSPHQPPCAFSCVDDGVCPSGYSCQDDGVCHRDGDQGMCALPSQVDGGDAGDAGDDGGADGP